MTKQARPSSAIRHHQQQSNHIKAQKQTGSNPASNIKIKGAPVMPDSKHMHNQSVAVVPSSQTGYGKLNMSSIDNLTQASKKAIAMHQKNQSMNAKPMPGLNNSIILNNSGVMGNVPPPQHTANLR